MKYSLGAFIIMCAVTLAALSSRSAAECIIFIAACQEFKNATAVFDGTVEATEPMRYNLQGRTFLTGPQAPSTALVHRAQVRVNRGWKGVEGSETIVLYGFDDFGDAVVDLTVGRRYFFYARKDEAGRLWAQACQRTRTLSEATADIAFLDGHSSSQGGSSFGQVRRRDATENETPVVGVMLTLDGPGGPKQIKTDEHGAFQFDRLANGAYTLAVDSAAGPVMFPLGGRDRFTINDHRECQESDFIIRDRR